MSDATFACPDLTTFCRLDELGLEVTGQRLEPDRAVLACRVVEPDEWCQRCGCQGSATRHGGAQVGARAVRVAAHAAAGHGAPLPLCGVRAHGRRGTAVRWWLRARPEPWRARVQIVAIDMSSEFRAAIGEVLPKARIAADHWNVMTRANQMVTQVRRRRSWDLHARRGRIVDPAWKYRTLLTCRQDNLSVAQRSRLDQILAADVELAVVWAIKEITVQLLATRTSTDSAAEWQQLETAVRATDLLEPAALFKTLRAWKPEIRTFCLTRVTNARTEAANLNAKNIKRAGRGYVNHQNYRARILRAATIKNGVNTPTTLKVEEPAWPAGKWPC